MPSETNTPIINDDDSGTAEHRRKPSQTSRIAIEVDGRGEANSGIRRSNMRRIVAKGIQQREKTPLPVIVPNGLASEGEAVDDADGSERVGHSQFAPTLCTSGEDDGELAELSSPTMEGNQ